ncbi:MAG: FAD-dependent monooxygenase [Pseudomonadota bacterium]|nr:FAD-dependent monooxygenase [Pseudomonadota bacterium]
MRTCDVIVVGGGPAGSAAAGRLQGAGANVVVLDRERFPRHKLCAGWITPQVMNDLAMEVAAYPHSFLSFRRLHWHLRGVRIPIPCVQHSIRRFEFDAWLLERSGAEVIHHGVRQIRRERGAYVIDEAFRCQYLIGAAGTSCPVRRTFFEASLPRPRALQTVTLEAEFPHEWRDPDCHLYFFDRGLPGYSWYVPKASGWLNIGVGAMAARLKGRNENIRLHWQHLAAKIAKQFDIALPADPLGYSYYVRGPVTPARVDNAFIAGDAAGLATRDLCEGIGPAIRSGQRAAAAILHDLPYSLDGVTGTSLGGGVVSRWIDWAFTRGG